MFLPFACIVCKRSMCSKSRALRLVAKMMTWLSLGMWSQCKIQKWLRRRDGPVKITVNFFSWCGLCSYIVNFDGRCVYSIPLLCFVDFQEKRLSTSAATGRKVESIHTSCCSFQEMIISASPRIQLSDELLPRCVLEKPWYARGVCNFYVRAIVTSSEFMMSLLQSRLY